MPKHKSCVLRNQRAFPLTRIHKTTREKIHEAAKYSSCVYLEIKASDVGMFRFLLEAYDNLALFTVLDKYTALLKVFYSPHQENEVTARLEDIRSLVAFRQIPFTHSLSQDF